MSDEVSLTFCQFISLRTKMLTVHTFFLDGPKVSVWFRPSNKERVPPKKQVSILKAEPRWLYLVNKGKTTNSFKGACVFPKQPRPRSIFLFRFKKRPLTTSSRRVFPTVKIIWHHPQLFNVRSQLFHDSTSPRLMVSSTPPHNLPVIA